MRRHGCRAIARQALVDTQIGVSRANAKGRGGFSRTKNKGGWVITTDSWEGVALNCKCAVSKEPWDFSEGA